MSTPSTATATLPPNPHYGYSHHQQNYQSNGTSYRQNNAVLNGASRLAGGAFFPGSSSNITSTGVGSVTLPRPNQINIPAAPQTETKGRTMSASHSISGQTSKKRQRSREPDWHSFYKNGLPKEVIVIDDDSPPPRVEDSFESPDGQAQNQTSRTVPAGNSRHAAKKRKRDDVGSAFDPTYGNGHTSNGNTPYKASGSGSSASTDRTTSAIHTTAATSLGSQYSHNGATIGYEEDLQPGTKRKRVATRQQIANEAKRREIETIGDAFTNYKPPPRPPIKAADVLVRQAADVSTILDCFRACTNFPQNSHTKNLKVDDDDGHYIVVPESDLTDRCKFLVVMFGEPRR